MIKSRAAEPDWATIAALLGTCLMEVRDGTQHLLTMIPLQKMDPSVQQGLTSYLVKLQDHAATGIQKAANVLIMGAQP